MAITPIRPARRKTEKKSHLDITHYQPISVDELKRIEEIANEMVKAGIKIEKMIMPRNEAEKRFGMRIYQGGAVPGKLLRIVNIPNIDVEACGGTHLNNTMEAGRIKILKTTKIQDGIDRVEFTAGEEAERVSDNEVLMLNEIVNAMKRFAVFKPEKNASRQLMECADFFSVPSEHVLKTVMKFISEIGSYNDKSVIAGDAKNVRNIKEACEVIFELYKNAKRGSENASKVMADSETESIAKRAENDKIFEIVDMDRKAMIKLCDALISKHPEMTVILVNRQGEVVGASECNDISNEVKNLCEGCCGSGGGKGRLAQGRLDFKKLGKNK